MREYTGTMARSRPGRVGVQASMARTTKSARTVPAAGDARTGGRPPPRPGCRAPRCARRRARPCRSTASASPRAKSAGCRAAQCGVNVAPSDPAAPMISCGLVGPEPAHVVLAEAERPRLVDLVLRPGPLGLAAHQVDRAALGEVAVDALARPRWRRRRRPSPAWRAASPAWPRARAGGPARRRRWRRAPSTSLRCGPRPRSRRPRARARRRAASGRPAPVRAPSTAR